MKTSMSRFQIHDDLTAPEGSQPLLRGVLSTGGQLPNFLGVLAGAPAALRATRACGPSCVTATWSRRRSSGSPSRSPSITTRSPGSRCTRAAARRTGLRHDDIALAREWDARDPRDAALLRYLKPLVTESVAPAPHLHEEARELGWTDEQLLEAMAVVALEGLTAMVNIAGDVPADGSVEESRSQPLRAA